MLGLLGFVLLDLVFRDFRWVVFRMYVVVYVWFWFTFYFEFYFDSVG